jgi:7-carboxy-7-deazaguanine synthase
LREGSMFGLKELTFETNGTQPLTEEFHWFLFGWFTRSGIDRERLTFSVSPKLSVSGEKREEAIRPEVIKQYQAVGHTYLKFVIASEEDCNEALEVIDIYRQGGFTGPVYLMPVGGVELIYSMNNKNVALLAMKHGLRYSDRLQVPLFKNEWGT